MGLIPWRNREKAAVPEQSQAPVAASLEQVRHDINRLFDSFFRDPWSTLPRFSQGGWRGAWSPSLDLSETENELVVKLELPGISAEDVEVSLSGNALMIEGEKKEEREDSGKDYYFAERRFGSFRRLVELPSAVDADSIKADFKNGVLSIQARKQPGADTRKRIPIG